MIRHIALGISVLGWISAIVYEPMYTIGQVIGVVFFLIMMWKS